MAHNRWLKKCGFKIGFLNVRSLLGKLSDVPLILSNANDPFHVFGFAESRLTDSISDDIISIPGYLPLRKDVKDKLQTGIIAYVHQSVNHKLLSNFDVYNIECLWIEVNLKGSKPIVIGFMYKNSAEHVDWYDRFNDMMDNVWNAYSEVILLGDFNINLLERHDNWKNMVDSCNLHQLINTPTRVTVQTQTLIDHIYVSNPQNVIEHSVPVYGLSDHFPVCITWSKRGTKIPRCVHKKISFRSYKNFNTEEFLSDLSKADFSAVYQHTNPDIALAVWYNTFNYIFDRHVPYRTKRVKHKARPPWLNEEIYAAIKIRDKLLSKTGNDEAFKKQRNKITAMKRAAKKKYFSELISSKSDTKSIWKAINYLSGKRSSPVIATELPVDCLNKHFSTVAEKVITNDYTRENDLLLLRDYCESKNIFTHLDIDFFSVHEVYKELSLLKQSKARGFDDLDSKILTMSAPIIAEHLTYIYNLCIEKCYFPQAFKDAKVIPLFKSGNPNDPSNYRPISILSTLSKPLEKHIKQSLLSHFTKFNLFHSNQSGFRKNHSCHTALTNLIEQWHSNINKDQFTGAIFVDFAKAFDVIDHSLLERKLVLYGVAPKTIKLIASFLCNRRQKVCQGMTTSDFMQIEYGVPQGSILGPILFSVYINDLPLYISGACELFADDTTLHNTHKHANSVCADLEKDIGNLEKWTKLNHMALHPQKSKFMLVTTRQKRQNIKYNLKEMCLDGKLLEEVEAHKLLGLTIDKNLSWSSHVSYQSKKLSQKVFQLNRIKYFIDQHTRKLFFHAYIQPDIDYASTCWDLASQNCLKLLHRLYKRSLKLILKKSSSLLPGDYKILNILPFDLRCRYNKGVLMYKIMNHLSPTYLYEKFKTITVRNKFPIFVPHPRTDLFMSSLSFSGSKLWNELPGYLKEKHSLQSFKAAYHKYLLNQI